MSSDTHFIGATSSIFSGGAGIVVDMRAFSGKIFFFAKYYQWVIDTLNDLNIQYNISLNKEVLSGDIFDLLQKNRLYMGAHVRMIVFDEGTDLHVLFTCKPAANSFEIFKKGVVANLLTDYLLPIQKYANYPFFGYNPINYHVKQSIKDTNCIDLILNEFGNVVQVPSGNIFMIHEQSLFTPSLEQGCSFDVLRTVIIEIALKSNMRVFDDCVLKPDELLEMDEIFAVNTVQGVTWISAFEDRRYFNKMSMKLTERLNVLAMQSIGR
jgi:branched-chain amino acid aminotransferase